MFFVFVQNIEVGEEHVDERSVDDLLSFINGGEKGTYELLFLSYLFDMLHGSINWSEEAFLKTWAIIYSVIYLPFNFVVIFWGSLLQAYVVVN